MDIVAFGVASPDSTLLNVAEEFDVELIPVPSILEQSVQHEPGGSGSRWAF